MATKRKKGPINRKQRLKAGPAWISTCEGKNIVKGYRRLFRVSRLCALIELRMCGAEISEAMIDEARAAECRLAASRAAKKALKEYWFNGIQNDHFAYIAGYTSAGFPYGTTWAELEADEPAEVGVIYVSQN